MKKLLIATGVLCAWVASPASWAKTVWQSEQHKFDLNANWQYDYGRVDDGQSSWNGDLGGIWRRQRLGLLLESKGSAELALEYDFASEQWTDAVVRLSGVWGGQLSIGQFKQPFGLEEIVNDRRSLFLEASLAGGFVIGRRLGAAWLWNPSDSAFGVQFSAFDRNLTGVRSSDGYAARAWWSPRWQAGEVRHLGLALTHERPDDDQFSLSARPQTRLRDLRVARSGTLSGADTVQRVALESLATQGSVYLQGEWLFTQTQRQQLSDYHAQAWYAQIGWLSGGARRGYRNGVIQGTDLGGVFELGARVAEVDLNDDAIRGGRARSLGAVLTWYQQPTLRAMLEWNRSNILDGGVRPDVDVLELRLQYVF